MNPISAATALDSPASILSALFPLESTRNLRYRLAPEYLAGSSLESPLVVRVRAPILPKEIDDLVRPWHPHKRSNPDPLLQSDAARLVCRRNCLEGAACHAVLDSKR